MSVSEQLERIVTKAIRKETSAGCGSVAEVVIARARYCASCATGQRRGKARWLPYAPLPTRISDAVGGVL